MGEAILWSLIKPILWFMIVVLSIIIGLWLIFSGLKANNPKNWKEISTDKSNPDTMTAYRIGSTIYYQSINK